MTSRKTGPTMDEQEIPIAYVARIIDQMVRTTRNDDEPGQRMIRKYRKLLAQAKRAQNNTLKGEANA